MRYAKWAFDCMAVNSGMVPISIDVNFCLISWQREIKQK